MHRYLAASLCFSPEHEFRFMLVNQFTRDMASINYLVIMHYSITWGSYQGNRDSEACILQEVCAALGAVCRLTTTDTIPAVINDVINKLKHDVSGIAPLQLSSSQHETKYSFTLSGCGEEE
jgi:hypothetical protein